MVSCKGQISPPSRRHFYRQNSKAEDFSWYVIFHLTAGRRMWAKKLTSLFRLSSQTSVHLLLFSPFCWWFNIFYLRQTLVLFFNKNKPTFTGQSYVHFSIFSEKVHFCVASKLGRKFQSIFPGENAGIRVGIFWCSPYFIVFTPRYSYTLNGCRKCVYLNVKSEISTHTAQF